MGNGLTITESLQPASQQLDTSATLARGALTYTEGGTEPEAVRMTLELDLEMYFQRGADPAPAMTPLQRMGWKQERSTNDSG